jgi:hypothetical protein
MVSPRLRLTTALCFILTTTGCATPGVPRPPSLNLPELTRDLFATRIGSTVQLRFTVPSRSTDKLPLRGSHLAARFCRSLGGQPCRIIPTPEIIVPLDTASKPSGRHEAFSWTDTLPEDLAHGDPRLLSYSVELLNIAGRSAGPSAPAFTAAGDAPAPVTNLHAEGSRLGILLRWNRDPSQSRGEVLLQRQYLAPKPDVKTSDIVQLTTPASSSPTTTTLLDTSVKADTTYRYTATRSSSVKIADRTFELRSAPSPSVEITLRPIYPPPAPTALTAAAFTSTAGAFAIDLIWQPVDDTDLITPLAGYNLYRASGGAPTRLNATPLRSPAFHDITAVPNTPYRYTVTAVDATGNESEPTGTVIPVQ